MSSDCYPACHRLPQPLPHTTPAPFPYHPAVAAAAHLATTGTDIALLATIGVALITAGLAATRAAQWHTR